MKSASLRTRPAESRMNTLASRSNALPSVTRVSQPRPTRTPCSPGASLLRLTLPPFWSDTGIFNPFPIRSRAPVIHSRPFGTLLYATWTSLYGDTIVDGKWPQSALKTLPYRAKLPFAIVTIDFAKGQRSFHRIVFGQIIAGNFAPGL